MLPSLAIPKACPVRVSSGLIRNLCGAGEAKSLIEEGNQQERLSL